MTIVVEADEEELEKPSENFGIAISYITTNHPFEFDR